MRTRTRRRPRDTSWELWEYCCWHRTGLCRRDSNPVESRKSNVLRSAATALLWRDLLSLWDTSSMYPIKKEISNTKTTLMARITVLASCFFLWNLNMLCNIRMLLRIVWAIGDDSLGKLKWEFIETASLFWMIHQSWTEVMTNCAFLFSHQMAFRPSRKSCEVFLSLRDCQETSLV